MAGIFKRAKDKISKRLWPKAQKKRVLFYSAQAKEFARQNRGALLEARILLRENIMRIRNGETVSNKKGNISIAKAATGSEKGKRNFLTAKVSINEKALFLKVVDHQAANEIMDASMKAEKILRESGYKIDGINVRQIKPHIIYEDWMKKMTFVVTEFFEKNDVIQVHDMKGTIIKRKIKKVLERLWRKTDRNLEEPLDISEKNSFYDAKTRTILLYDFF